MTNSSQTVVDAQSGAETQLLTAVAAAFAISRDALAEAGVIVADGRRPLNPQDTHFAT